MKWPTFQLSDIVRMVGGGTPSTKRAEFWSGGIPWVSPKDMVGREIRDTEDHINEEAVTESATQVVPDGSVLVVVRSGILVRRLPIAIARVPVALNQDMKALVPHDQLIPDFLAYFFEASAESILAQYVKRGATVHSIDIGKLEKLPVPVPAKSEQQRIVEILDQADTLRKKRAEADAKAARVLPALFYKMFGDPATNPMGWPTEGLAELFDVVGGGTPSSSDSSFWQGDIPWVSPKDMKRDVITDTEDHITEEAVANSATRLVKKGSILVVYRSGILAHTFPVAIAGRDLTLNQDMKALTSKGELLNEYLYGWLISARNLTLSCVKKGATVHNVDGGRFLSLRITKPTLDLQKRFAEELSVLLRLKATREAAERQISSLFRVLLCRAFSGDLTAKWREAHMKELLAEMDHQAKLLNLPKEALLC